MDKIVLRSQVEKQNDKFVDLLEEEREEMTKLKNFEHIIFGMYKIKTWYISFSFYF